MNPRLFLLSLWLPAAALAHDIPSDVTAHVFFKPTGSKLQLLIRVPLKAMRDLEFPEQGRTGYLDVDKLLPMLPDASTLWIVNVITILEGAAPLPKPRIAATRISFASDRSFASFNEALAHVTGPPLANSSNVTWDQVLFDMLLEYPIASDRSKFSIRPGFERLGERVVTALRFVPPGEGAPVRAFELQGDPGLVPLDPHWQQAARRFVQLGFLHILDGTDHLLFLLCLVIPFRRWRPLVGVVTAFTVAHSITLLASAHGLAPDALWFPPLIEALIAASIVYMSLENIVGSNSAPRRWAMAFGFGLVHGFGFSFALRETLQFAGTHQLSALLAFNVGVELGQLLVLLFLIPLLDALFRFVVPERTGTIILSALVTHTGWHWLMERWDKLAKFRLEWPTLDAAFWASAMRWVIVILILGWTALWLRRRRAELSAAAGHAKNIGK